jgi:hypothetical protein
MIYIIITTSINTKYNGLNAEHRKNRYLNSIHFLLSLIKGDPSIKPIVVENNNLKESYLDELECDIHYTNNNAVSCQHKGVNELLDIQSVINHYNIQDDDIVIKLTGRYKILNLNFINMVKNNRENYDAFIKFFNVCALQFMENDCVLGLFAIKCKYLKQFHYKCWTGPECEFADYVRKNIKNIMEVENLDLECCFADDLRILNV